MRIERLLHPAMREALPSNSLAERDVTMCICQIRRKRLASCLFAPSELPLRRAGTTASPSYKFHRGDDGELSIETVYERDELDDKPSSRLLG